jgi:hypothetical protein
LFAVVRTLPPVFRICQGKKSTQAARPDELGELRGDRPSGCVRASVGKAKREVLDERLRRRHAPIDAIDRITANVVQHRASTDERSVTGDAMRPALA